jgi:predicted porin
MKKASLVLGLLAASTSAAWAQSSVTMYGIVDVGVRLTTNAGSTVASRGESISSVIPGGMSQSRLGFNITEDMGGGLKAIANMEHRLASDTGNIAAGDFWRQVWVGVQSSEFGRVTIGRQFNVLFDLYTSTFASYKYSPYSEVYKPELGMSLGARNDNMVKYVAEVGGLRGEVQMSAGEGNPTAVGANGKSIGFIVRYATGPFAGGFGYMDVKDTAGKSAKAKVAGAGYTSGPLYVSLGWAQNEFEKGFNPTLIATYAGSIAGALNTSAALAKERDMWSMGATYQLTPQLNLGAHYWKLKQDSVAGVGGLGDGNGKYFSMIADYALSKRTDFYVETDHTRMGGKLTLANTAVKRAGYTMGLRHRF